MQRHFLQAMEKIEGLINLWSAPSSDASKSVLVAVSGGADSMCLADLFLQNFGPDRFAVAHCNFRLRGDESDGDEALVRDWAEEHGIRLHVTSFDTEGFALKNGVSIEMAARELRYSWFAGLCQDNDYAAVAVAHNANDNAETLILNLLRGTGLRGLEGMAQVSALPYCESDIKLIRPIIECTRKMIEGYAFAHRLAYRNDSTNASSDYKRNRIRNEVFPIFEKINPSFVRTLNREMGYFTEASEIVDDYCASNSVHNASSEDVCTISVPELLAHKHWRYLLYHMLEPYGFNASSLTSIEELLESDRTISGKRFESATHELVIERTDICVRPLASEESLSTHDSIMEVRGPGIYNFNACRWQIEVMNLTPDMQLKQPQGTLIADADKLQFPFVCRRWRQGDWMVPFGMKGRKKISDIFADMKYTSTQKDGAIMMIDCRGDLAAQQHIAGVLGLRIDDRYKITPTTRSIIRITLL